MASIGPSLRRDIGRWGLVALGISGVVGSGWLYAPLETAKHAGPAALIAWIVGGALMLIMGFCLAELACAYPLSGSGAQVAAATHGRGMSLVNMWLLYFSYVTTPSIEATSIVTYSATYLPWLTVGKEANLSPSGQVVTFLLVGVFTVLNFFGVRWFIRMNSWITWWKIAIPAGIAVIILTTRFESTNIVDSPGGFAPMGAQGIIAALSSGGIVFTLCGFRIIADLAAEARNPAKDIPFAFLASTAFAVVLYLVVQVAFLGALAPADFADGWSNLKLPQANAPFISILLIVGLPAMAKLLYADAILSPGGSCLAYIASTGRVGYAAAQQNFAPKIFLALNRSGVPVMSLLVCWAISGVITFAYPRWDQLANLNAAAYFLSVVTVPVSVAVLRRVDPHGPRPFRVAGGTAMCALAFTTNLLIVYWSGIGSFVPLLAALAIIVAVAVTLGRIRKQAPIAHSWRPLLWLLPMAALLCVVGWFGNKDFGGVGALPELWDTGIVALGALALFYMAVKMASPADEVHRRLGELRSLCRRRE
ncbi:MAG: APC family permease [Phycisphaerales bacterium]|nr:APC family permease [Phycisphaerales bacterium]